MKSRRRKTQHKKIGPGSAHDDFSGSSARIKPDGGAKNKEKSAEVRDEIGFAVCVRHDGGRHAGRVFDVFAAGRPRRRGGREAEVRSPVGRDRSTQNKTGDEQSPIFEKKAAPAAFFCEKPHNGAESQLASGTSGPASSSRKNSLPGRVGMYEEVTKRVGV